MTSHTATIDLYLRAYGEREQTERDRLISAYFAPDAVLCDPPFIATGHAELSGSFAAVQSQFPDHHFERITEVDEHHDVARYGWTLVASDGTIAVAGTDIVTFNATGQIGSVAGFFGDVVARNDR